MAKLDELEVIFTWTAWLLIVLGAAIAFVSGPEVGNYGVVLWFIGIIVQLEIGAGAILRVIILRLAGRHRVASQT